MTAPHWMTREPDEPLADWMLRLQISHAAIGYHATAAITAREAS